MHSAITISFTAFILTFFYLFCQMQIFCRDLHSIDIIVIPAAWHFEKITHLTNVILFFVSVNSHIFYACSHSLSVSKRKSRISSFWMYTKKADRKRKKDRIKWTNKKGKKQWKIIENMMKILAKLSKLISQR